MTTNLVISPTTLSSSSPNMILLIPVPVQPQYTHKIYSISLFQGDTYIPSLSFPCYLASGSMDHSMIIHYFMVNIYFQENTYHVCLSGLGYYLTQDLFSNFINLPANFMMLIFNN